MVKLAVLHEALSEQVKEQVLPNIDIVTADIDSIRFLEHVVKSKPEVLVLDLNLLGNDPLSYIRDIRTLVQPKTIIAVYSYAKWSLIQQITAEGVRIVKAPINMRLLQSSMLSIVVKEIMQTTQRPSTTANNFTATPRYYSMQQLSKLQQIKSVVDCECPNHITDLVIALSAFESYSRDCKSRNAQDAEIHDILYRSTAQARHLMEQALLQLCDYEGINLAEETTFSNK